MMIRGLLGTVILLFGLLFWIGWVTGEDDMDNGRVFALALALTLGGIFFLSSKKIGAAFKNFDSWSAIQQKRNQEMWGNRGSSRQEHRASPETDYTVTPEQVSAVANPETASALQNLQNLLYTHTITDAEYQAAKDNLLSSSAARARADGFSQVEKLVELHQAGILSDLEFAAAKLKALGLA